MSLPAALEPGASLHEVRTEWRAGRALGRVYRTPNGSLEARLAPHGASLHRVFGPIAPDVTVSWDDLAALAGAFARWEAVRDEWAAYFERGIVMAGCAAQIYWAPGRGTPQRTVGLGGGSRGRVSGVSLERKDEVRPFAAARTVAPGIEVIADLWRSEPTIGPAAGERIGERWLVEGRVAIDARRLDAHTRHGATSFPWLMWESEVPAELLALRAQVPHATP
jgi:hypothetical protein